MPEHAPLAKVVATKGYGAEVVLAGATYDESYEHACRLQRERGLVFVHAFNDPCVMAGQGTIGLDAIANFINHPKLRQLPFYLETPNELPGYATEIKLLKSLYR